MTDEKNLLLMIGMCRGAGKAVLGVPMICELLRKRGVNSRENGNNDILVIEASDTSENTHKRITDKCIYYKVKHIRIKSDCVALGKAVGKNATAAIAVTDKNFCIAIEKQITSESKG